MLGTEPQIIQEYVETGLVKLVFWPVLNHGNPSVFSTLTAECVGQQNPDAFWTIHNYLFENQRELWGADRDYYINAAIAAGADQATFEACYDGASGIDTVMALDAIRRERGVYSQPVFNINGVTYAGAASFDAFALVIDDNLRDQ